MCLKNTVPQMVPDANIQSIILALKHEFYNRATSQTSNYWEEGPFVNDAKPQSDRA